MKRIIIFSAITLLVLELVCFVMAPPADDLSDPVLANLEYVPFMMAAMTFAFVAALELMFIFIVAMLRATLKENMIGMFLLALAFLTPIIYYQAVY